MKDWRPAAAVVAYVAALTLWLYADAIDRLGFVLSWLVLVAIHAATGFLIGRGWALVLPIAAVPIAIPASLRDGDDGAAVATAIFPFLPVATVLIVLGLGFRRLFDEKSSLARMSPSHSRVPTAKER